MIENGKIWPPKSKIGAKNTHNHQKQWFYYVSEMVNGVLVGHYVVWIESYQFDATVIRKIWHSERRRVTTKSLHSIECYKLVAKSNNFKPASNVYEKSKRANEPSILGWCPFFLVLCALLPLCHMEYMAHKSTAYTHTEREANGHIVCEAQQMFSFFYLLQHALAHFGPHCKQIAHSLARLSWKWTLN